MRWSMARMMGAVLMGGAWAAPVAAAPADDALAADAPAQDAPPSQQPFDFGPVPGWIMMLGPTFGGSFGSGGGGGYLGAELSLTRLSEGTWIGLYVDGLFDFGRGGEPMFTAGPQLGYTLLGLDGGVALRLVDGEAELGGTGRLLIDLAIVSLYGRYAYFADSEDHLGQVGLMFKLPVWASETAPPTMEVGR